MRAELANKLVARYGEGILRSVRAFEPIDERVTDYNRHSGVTSLQLVLNGDPGLVVIDTSKFRHFHFAWIENRQAEALNVFVSSGRVLPANRSILQDYSHIVVEGVGITFSYNSHDRQLPYRDQMRPVW